jgi:hypothetical protein
MSYFVTSQLHRGRMIRSHTFRCVLPRADADALNRESGRVYTQTLIWQYRIYRRKGIWLSPGASERLGDFLSSTTLHAHSRDRDHFKVGARSCSSAPSSIPLWIRPSARYDYLLRPGKTRSTPVFGYVQPPL